MPASDNRQGETPKEMAIGWLEEHGVPFFDDL
jgi:hypothetical protein